MKLGCAYFGNRILKHARKDMEELRDMGCSFVVHTYNENDMMFCHKAVCEIVAMSQDVGLEVYIDPWGVGKVFGGESYSNFVMQNHDACQMVSDGRAAGCACPNHPRFREFMREWTDAAAETGAETFFWDEPHFYVVGWVGTRPNTWGCLCDTCRRLFQERTGLPFPTERTPELNQFQEDCIFEFLSELVAYAHEKGRKNALCVLPNKDPEHSTANFARMASIPKLDIFGTDPYWVSFKKDLHEFVGSNCREVLELCRRHGTEAQIWIQNFHIPAEREQEIVTATDLIAECGVRNIAVWGFDSCRHLSWIRPANPDLVWDKTKEAYSRVAGMK